MQLEFFKISKSNIFCDDFQHLSKNNIIDFNESKLNVLYAPNGVGKSSLCKVLNGDGDFLFKYGDNTYSPSNCDLFHIINDQNSRNIIKGSAKDFLLGDDIVREFNLKEWLENKFENYFNSLKNKYKDDLKISKKSDKKIEWLDSKTRELIKKIVKSGAKSSDITINEFINIVSNLKLQSIDDYEDNKLNFIKDDKNINIINEFLNISSITCNNDFDKIEQCDDAVLILNKYHDYNSCIVCDNDNVNVEDLLIRKKYKKEEIINNLDNNIRKILENIINKLSEEDPFEIKKQLTKSVSIGDMNIISELINQISNYIQIYSKISNNYLYNTLTDDFKEKFDEYKKMLNNELNFTDEDIMFIEQFIEKNINKKIRLERKENKIVITLDSESFLETDRNDLKLSSGEQNFISLSFELLKAKNINKKFIVIDDPISSFDSIFKNKLVYSIIKFLDRKNTIILTHNIDLLRLIEFQNNNKFGLYLFNNFEGQENGFIKISDYEKNILISIPKLLSLFRSSEFNINIKNEELFLYSLIPFMRGYVNFIDDIETKKELNKLMHGYMDEIVNLNVIYKKIFSKDLLKEYNVKIGEFQK